MVGHGCKIVSDDKIVGELGSQAAAMGTSLAAMNMPHTLGTASPLSNIGDILESGRECTEAERERCVAVEAIARLVGKAFGGDEAAGRGRWGGNSLWESEASSHSNPEFVIYFSTNMK